MKIVRKLGRYRSVWFLVSRSFNSQQSQKEASTQERAKVIKKKPPGKTLVEKRELAKKPLEPNRTTWTFRGDCDQKWPGDDSSDCSHAVVKLNSCTLFQSNTPNSLNNKCTDSSGTKQNHTGLLFLHKLLPTPFALPEERGICFTNTPGQNFATHLL